MSFGVTVGAALDASEKIGFKLITSSLERRAGSMYRAIAGRCVCCAMTRSTVAEDR